MIFTKILLFLLAFDKIIYFLNIMNTLLIDKIKGLVYGQAIGDAIGLGTGFLNKQQINQYYPNQLTDYQQIIQDKHRARWQKGDWTDDTDQMLCILDSILANQKVDYLDIAQRIHTWAYNGGKGIGNTVYQVLTVMPLPNLTCADCSESFGLSETELSI
jgi:ADP-ribosylglycohydrolase